MKSETRTLILVYSILLILGLAELGLIYAIHNWLDAPIILENPSAKRPTLESPRP